VVIGWRELVLGKRLTRQFAGVVKSRNDKSKCMFIGHSFGGLILEAAIVQALLGAIFDKTAEPVDSPTKVDSPTDLIGSALLVRLLLPNNSSTLL
jgi:Putative serine esterase (DUF676)